MSVGNLDNTLDLDGDLAGQRTHAHRRAGMPAAIAEHFEGLRALLFESESEPESEPRRFVSKSEAGHEIALTFPFPYADEIG